MKTIEKLKEGDEFTIIKFNVKIDKISNSKDSKHVVRLLTYTDSFPAGISNALIVELRKILSMLEETLPNTNGTGDIDFSKLR